MRKKEFRSRLRFSREMLEPVLQLACNFSDAARRLGYPEYTIRGASSKLAKKAAKLGIDCAHFNSPEFRFNHPLRGAALGKSDDELFALNTTFFNRVHRKKLIEIRGCVCENCGITEWLGEELNPDIHHKNRDRTDNRQENLLVVCSNCHRFFHQRRVKRAISTGSNSK